MQSVFYKKMSQFDFVQCYNQVTIRTFNRHIYKLRTHLLVQNVETGEYRPLSEIYYMIRSVQTLEGELIARRKNPASELWIQDVAIGDIITGTQQVN